jgi:hypothetical protein
MQHQSGDYKGYFAWQMNTNGSVKGSTPASDGMAFSENTDLNRIYLFLHKFVFSFFLFLNMKKRSI